MFDATELEWNRRAHAYEMGEDSPTDRAWYAYSDAAEAAIVRRGWGDRLDADQDAAGFSLDGAYDAWEAGMSVDAYIEQVARDRSTMGLRA